MPDDSWQRDADVTDRQMTTIPPAESSVIRMGWTANVEELGDEQREELAEVARSLEQSFEALINEYKREE